MQVYNLFILFYLFINVYASTNSRMHQHQITLIDKINTCKYASIIFPNICPNNLTQSYVNIYENPYIIKVWDFHQNECIINDNSLRCFFVIILLISVLLFNLF
jgi:hypothetical protein